MILNFGINNPGIAYEVALEVLGQRMQPFIMAIIEEKTKPTPSEAMIAYCEARKTAISLMQDSLNPDDHETIAAILDKNDPRAHFFSLKIRPLILFRHRC